ncbi:hypothetical protein N8550_03505 [Pirellulaceae bacterium]|nr:hypothetical protein [Pirellulaceae bacterium]
MSIVQFSKRQLHPEASVGNDINALQISKEEKSTSVFVSDVFFNCFPTQPARFPSCHRSLRTKTRGRLRAYGRLPNAVGWKMMNIASKL